jgi:hypothetical protein
LALAGSSLSVGPFDDFLCKLMNARARVFNRRSGISSPLARGGHLEIAEG